MARNYPHLSPRSGPFPDVEGVNVWKWRNAFNYFRWKNSAQIQLANVPYPADFSQVVDWESTEERDRILDGYVLGEYYGKFDTHFRLDKNSVVKLPIPFDVADPANYLIVRNSQATSIGDRISYEDETGVSSLFFFVLDCKQLAPSTTELTLKLDVWTTYKHLVDFSHGMVERGHAPMWAAATVEEFLQNPLDKTDHLTAPDVSVNSEGQIISWNKPTLMDNEQHLICWASNYDWTQLEDDISQANPATGDIGAIIFDGECDKYVQGFEWDLGADSLELGMRTVKESDNVPPHALGAQSLNQPGAYIYGVQAEKATSFFDFLFSRYPQYAQNIQAVFLVPSSIITATTTFSLGGETVSIVQPKQVAVDIKLEKASCTPSIIRKKKLADLTVGQRLSFFGGSMVSLGTEL